MARFLPSNTQLPKCWNEHMDEFICQCEGLGDVDTDTMILGLKRKFPDDLSHVCILPDAVERRVQALELMDNDYFKLGMQAAVKKAEEAGFKLPPMNFNQYAKKESDDENIEDVNSRMMRLGLADDQNVRGAQSAFKRISSDLLVSAKLRAANNLDKGKEAANPPTTLRSSSNTGAWPGRGKENTKYPSAAGEFTKVDHGSSVASSSAHRKGF